MKLLALPYVAIIVIANNKPPSSRPPKKYSCKNLLFEAANFNGTNIRLSSKKLGLRTEASNLFEKGLDPNNAIKAINRACALIEDLGCGEICEDFIYVYPDEN